MKHSNKILDLLLKGANKNLNTQELNFLKENLNIENIEDYTELIGAYLAGQNDLSPSAQVKENLMQHFETIQEQQQKKGFVFKLLFIKLSAAAVFILGVSAALIYLFPNNEPIQTANDTNELINMEFEEFTETEEIKEEEMKEETKYLLYVDFFSNSSLIGK
jgi:hypothetical protein